MKSKKQQAKLVSEMKELIKPGFKSIEDIKKVESRGSEILSELINDDILHDCLKLGSKDK